MMTTTRAGIPIAFDAEGFMLDHRAWTRDIGEEIARAFGVDHLTSRHWEVIDFCRLDNDLKGTPPTLRRITRMTAISTKEMHDLFLDDPGTLASKIAGLTKPKAWIE